jgi:SAM-dependent methyltransferase
MLRLSPDDDQLFRRSPEASIYVEPACRSQRSLFENARVLDLGCGPGNYAQMYIGLGAREVVGVDASQANIIEAKRDNRDSRCTFHYREIFHEDISDFGAFDLVVGFWTLHFKPADVSWQHLSRLLAGLIKRDGRFLSIAQFPTCAGRYQPFARLCYPGLRDGDPLPAERDPAPFELLDASLLPILSITCNWPRTGDVMDGMAAGGLAIERNIALDPVVDAHTPEVYRRVILTFRQHPGADPHPTRLLVFRRNS